MVNDELDDFTREMNAPTLPANSEPPAAPAEKSNPAPTQPATETAGHSAPADDDILLFRGVDGDGGGSFGETDLGDLLKAGFDHIEEMRAGQVAPPATGAEGGSTGVSFGIGGTGQKPNTLKIDTATAAMGAAFYVDVLLPLAFNTLGNLIAGEDYKYKGLGKDFEKGYRETTAKLLASGELVLPSPMQCFIAMTMFLVCVNGFNMFKERKKTATKKAKQLETEKRRSELDESRPIEIQDTPAASSFGGQILTPKAPLILTPIPSDPTVEIAKRGRFSVEDGFYTYDTDNVYIKKPDRKFGPSDLAKQVLKTTSKSGEVKEKIKALYNGRK